MPFEIWGGDTLGDPYASAVVVLLDSREDKSSQVLLLCRTESRSGQLLSPEDAEDLDPQEEEAAPPPPEEPPQPPRFPRLPGRTKTKRRFWLWLRVDTLDDGVHAFDFDTFVTKALETVASYPGDKVGAAITLSNRDEWGYIEPFGIDLIRQEETGTARA